MVEAMTATGVRVERSGAVLELKLDRPARGNALTPATIERLTAALTGAEVDGARTVVVSSSHRGKFCTGFDLGGDGADAVGDGSGTEAGAHLVAALRALPMPTVAVIDGPAIGGGLSLALECDLRIASDRASFGLPAAALGLVYPPDNLERLVEVVGVPGAMWLALSGERVDAPAAAAWGLVQHVAAIADLDATVERITERLAASAPLVARYTKTAVRAHAPRRPRDDVDAALQAVLSSADYQEAVAAVRERRRPSFGGV